MLRSILLVGLLIFSSTVAIASPRLTPEKAKDIAKAFCQRLGVQQSKDASAEFSENVNSFNRRNIFWQPRWRVGSADGVVIEVADATGIVCNFHNFGLMNSLAQEKRPAVDSIPKEQAVRIATAALHSTGNADNLLFWTAQLYGDDRSNLVAEHYWIVRWRRSFQGIPYRHQHASVVIQADTGEVEGLVLMYPTPPTDSILNIASVFGASRSNRAIETAKTLIANEGIQDLVLHSVGSEIVQPNEAWRHATEAVPFGPPRLAWVCQFTDLSKTYEVWVDANTDKVIGGESYGVASSSASHQSKTLSEILKSTNQVNLYVRNRDGNWKNQPLTILNEKSQKEAFHWIKATSSFQVTAPALLPVYKLVFKAENQKSFTAGYDVDSGLFGAGNEWAIAPTRFRVWIKTLVSR